MTVVRPRPERNQKPRISSRDSAKHSRGLRGAGGAAGGVASVGVNYKPALIHPPAILQHPFITRIEGGGRKKREMRDGERKAQRERENGYAKGYRRSIRV